MFKLDESISASLFSMKQLERAYHDEGPWHFVVGGVATPAVKVVKDTSVSLVALTETPRGLFDLNLLCGVEVVASRPQEFADGLSQLSWTFALSRDALHV